jgi:hypothetical protein
MARQNVALAQPPQSPTKKRRSRGRKRHANREASRAPAPVFDDLEQAFFAAAPPDEATPAGAVESFDDLIAGPAPPDPLASVRRAFGAARAALGRLFAPASPQRSPRA